MPSCACSRRSFLQLGAVAGAALLAKPAFAAPGATADLPLLRPAGAPTVGGLRVLAGSLHDHSTDSDGDAPSADIARYVQAHARELGLDFLSFTEHSDLFPASPAGADPWSRSLQVAQQFSDERITLLRGFEWTNDQQNHLNVIGSQGWIRRDEGFTMTPFWDWIAADAGALLSPLAPSLGGADGLGQFNHPASKGPLNWDDYTYHAGAARRMATIECREHSVGWYWFALFRGWTVGPVMNADYHPWAASGLLANPQPGRAFGQATFYPGQRSLVVAQDTSRPAILAALAARRTAASDRPDLWATLRTKDGQWMGSTVAAEPGERLKLVIDAGTSASRLTSVTLFNDLPDDAEVAAHYFRENPPDKRDPADLDQHRLAYQEQQRRWEATGRATFKGSLDVPPAGATAVTVPWEDRHVQVKWQVPTTRSPRPDGAHFVYAVVTREDGAKVTTAPLLVR